jgi:hypothetical protein
MSFLYLIFAYVLAFLVMVAWTVLAYFLIDLFAKKFSQTQNDNKFLWFISAFITSSLNPFSFLAWIYFKFKSPSQV